MSVEEVLFELKRKVQSKLPADINVTGLEFEGPELVIYTDDPKSWRTMARSFGTWPRSFASELWSVRT